VAVISAMMNSPSSSRSAGSSGDSNQRLEGLAARLQSIQEVEKEKKDVLGKYELHIPIRILPSHLLTQVHVGVG
jgi:hypothetical protein